MSPPNSIRWDLERTLGSKGCPICRATQAEVTRVLDALLYESVNDSEVRRHAAQSLGFCQRHAWQMRAGHGSALGIAFLNRSALKQWQSQLEQARKPSGRGILERFRKLAAHANRAKAKCLVCERQQEIEQRYIETLLEALPEPDFRAGWSLSDGLCRPHFACACEAAPRVETLETLLAIQTEINARLIVELDEFIRKNDYRFMAEGFGAEGDAWIRAIEHLAGAADLSR